MEKWMDLGNIFDLEQWEYVQNSLSDITEMAIITVDYKGRPKTVHSGCCDFCQKVREDELLGQYCQKCDARGGLEAVRANKPYIYKCYFSIIDIAIPIIVKDQYIGAIMAGQVRLFDDNKGENAMEQIYVPANKRYIEDKRTQFIKDFEKIPRLSLERVRVIAKMIFYLCNYMVAESIHKGQIIEKYETMCKVHGIMDEFPEELINGVENERKGKRDYAGLKETDEQGLIRYSNTTNPIIQDIFSYISTHREESPSLAKMAEYCNVSTSYLSRLFSKEVGESYSSFLARLKVERAKTLLETTGKSVYEISDELGFSEAGYFIKIFKKYVGLTPAAYRSYFRIS
ncbi:MAG: PocR ligand-binding domain-containing protein [Eubacteriales bacterium]|nr:PocR ligand-binding domain-containing protein [Eubacteriales bacterium]